MRKLSALVLFAILAMFVALVVQPAFASTCTLDALPTSGTLTAARLNSRFSQVESCVNGNLGASNMSTSDKITTTYLASPKAYMAVAFTWDMTEVDPGATGAFNDQGIHYLPANATLVGVSVSDVGCSAGSYTVTIQKNDSSTIATLSVTTGTALFQAENDALTGGGGGDYVDIDASSATECGAGDLINIVLYYTLTHTS